MFIHLSFYLSIYPAAIHPFIYLSFPICRSLSIVSSLYLCICLLLFLSIWRCCYFSSLLRYSFNVSLFLSLSLSNSPSFSLLSKKIWLEYALGENISSLIESFKLPFSAYSTFNTIFIFFRFFRNETILDKLYIHTYIVCSIVVNGRIFLSITHIVYPSIKLSSHPSIYVSIY